MSKKAEQTADMLTKCSGTACKGQNEARYPHTCPYRSEIHDDTTTLCECCNHCVRECAMDV